MQYAGGADPAYAAFKSFCKELAACGGPVSVLLVSGGGKKKALDTLKVRQLTYTSGHSAIRLQCSRHMLRRSCSA